MKHDVRLCMQGAETLSACKMKKICQHIYSTAKPRDQALGEAVIYQVIT